MKENVYSWYKPTRMIFFLAGIAGLISLFSIPITYFFDIIVTEKDAYIWLILFGILSPISLRFAYSKIGKETKPKKINLHKKLTKQESEEFNKMLLHNIFYGNKTLHTISKVTWIMAGLFTLLPSLIYLYLEDETDFDVTPITEKVHVFFVTGSFIIVTRLSIAIGMLIQFENYKKNTQNL